MQERSFLELFFFLEQIWIGPLNALRAWTGERPVSSARRLMIAMMAKMADADGVRQADETSLIEEHLVRWFSEGKGSQLEAFRLMRDARTAPIRLEDYARKFSAQFSWSLAMRASAFDLLCSVAIVDGELHDAEERLLDSCAFHLRIPETEAERLMRQYRAYRSAETEHRSRANGSSAQAERKVTESHDATSWAAILGVQNGASSSEVKRAYRKLVLMYHPDRLKSHGLPPEQVRLATERFLRIQKAYEQASSPA